MINQSGISRESTHEIIPVYKRTFNCLWKTFFWADEIRSTSKMKEGVVPVLPFIPALMAMMMYYLVWNYRICGEAQNGGVNSLLNV
jgi:hypothetical protein